MDRSNSPGREIVDQATAELRRKIDEMLQMSQASVDPIPERQTQSNILDTGLGTFGAYNHPTSSQQQQNLMGLKMDDFEFNAPIKDEKEEIQAEV